MTVPHFAACRRPDWQRQGHLLTAPELTEAGRMRLGSVALTGQNAWALFSGMRLTRRAPTGIFWLGVRGLPRCPKRSAQSRRTRPYATSRGVSDRHPAPRGVQMELSMTPGGGQRSSHMAAREPRPALPTASRSHPERRRDAARICARMPNVSARGLVRGLIAGRARAAYGSSWRSNGLG